MKTIVKSQDLERQADKFLTFVLADERYGIPIQNVLEIVGLTDITPVPRTPRYIRGIINLRGRIIPVIDLRRKFDLPEAKLTPRTCIVVVQVEGVDTGLLVDKVLEVTAIS